MRGERQLLGLGEYLVRRACQRLPQDIRPERYREWAAELPAILHDPQVRFAPWRAARMLAYAADTLRAAAMGLRSPRLRPLVPEALDLMFPIGGVVVVAVAGLSIALAPGYGQNYIWLAWGLLLVAHGIRKRVHPAGRMTALLGVSATLALAASFLWNAAQAPGDWVNYALSAAVLLTLLDRPVGGWAGARRTRHAPAPR
jgi:hypothetical protein